MGLVAREPSEIFWSRRESNARARVRVARETQGHRRWLLTWGVDLAPQSHGHGTPRWEASTEHGPIRVRFDRICRNPGQLNETRERIASAAEERKKAEQERPHAREKGALEAARDEDPSQSWFFYGKRSKRGKFSAKLALRCAEPSRSAGDSLPFTYVSALIGGAPGPVLGAP